MSSHDERSIYITTMVQNQSTVVATLAERMPTNDSISRIHNRIDEMSKTLADKNDIRLIYDDLRELREHVDNVEDKVTKNYIAIKEIKSSME